MTDILLRRQVQGKVYCPKKGKKEKMSFKELENQKEKQKSSCRFIDEQCSICKTKILLTRMRTWKLSYYSPTWSIKACGECTKIDAFSFGEDSRHSWASVALALYVNAILVASFPSYRTCLWCSAKWISLSDLNLKVLWKNKAKLNTHFKGNIQ